MIPLRIRPEEPRDAGAIRVVNEQAFGRPLEADLVDRLRRDGELVLSLVAEEDAITGHVAFSRLTLPHHAARAVALGPVAVLPERQGQGRGESMIREGLRRLAGAGEDLVLVLGEPDYYGRFGFSPEAARRLATPYDGPYLQALALSDSGRAARGPVLYARAFADLA